MGHNAIAALRFGVVEGGVRLGEETVRIGPQDRARRAGYADAGRHPSEFATGMNDTLLGKATSELLGNDHRSSGAGVGEEHHEFLSTVAGNDIRWAADRLAQTHADDTQALVAGGMAIGVIIGLEAVDIDHKKAERRVLPGAACGLTCESLVEGPAVDHAGQPIGLGKIFQLLRR